VLERLAALELITDPADPALGVVVCAGRAGCAHGKADTQADGIEVIELLRRAPGDGHTVHLSGCDKRCASRAPHDLVLIAAADGRYVDDATGREGTARKHVLGTAP